MNVSNVNLNSGDIVIDLKEYIWRILEQWKAIVLFALIIALLFSGFMYVRLTNNSDGSEETKSFEDIFGELSPEDQGTIMGVLNEKRARDAVRDYINDSLLMKLDPYEVKSLSMSWSINSDESINKSLMASYLNELSSDSIVMEVSRAWGDRYDPEQIRDLLTTIEGIPLDSEDSGSGNMLNLFLYIPEGDDAEAAYDAIIKAFSAISKHLKDEIGDHTTTLIGNDCQIKSDNDLSDKQYSIYNKYYNLNNQVNNLKDKLTTEQKTVYERMISENHDNEDAIAEESDETIVPKVKFFNKKRLILGFILGCALYLFAYLVYYIFSFRVRSSKYVEVVLGIRTLAEWYPECNNRLSDFLFKDSFIYKLHHKGHLDRDIEVRRAISSIASFFDGKEDRRILIVNGLDDSDNVRTFVDHIMDGLYQKNISVTEAEVDILKGMYLSEDVIMPVDAVVMVFEIKETGIKTIHDTFGKCYCCEKPVLGAAYVG